MSKPLSRKAETLRQEIKKLVAQSVPKVDTEEEQLAVFTENAYGKSYDGTLFDDKVSRLVNEMGLTVWNHTYYRKFFAHC
jgi:hypothetical protein